MRHAHAEEPVEGRQRVEAPQQPTEVERGPQRRGDPHAVDDHDVVAATACGCRSRTSGRRSRDPVLPKTHSGGGSCTRRAGQDVDAVQPGRGAVGDDRRLAGRRAAGPPHAGRRCRAPAPRRTCRAARGGSAPGRPARRRNHRDTPSASGLLGGERAVQRERAALVRGGRGPAAASTVSFSCRRWCPIGGRRRSASSTGTTYAVPRTARSPPGECPQVPGQHLESAPKCPVSALRVPPSARSARGECPQVPGQKMMSPDLRRRAEQLEGLVEDVGGLRVGAALLHVGQVRLVGLDLRRRRRVLRVEARRAGRTWGSPTSRAPRPRPRTSPPSGARASRST